MSSKGSRSVQRQNNGIVSIPVARSSKQVSQPARQSTQGTSRVVKHRELVHAGLQGFTTFQISATNFLNPGLSNSFPWLSKEARNYQEYTIRKFWVEYIPLVATTTAGEVMLGFEYDASRPAPTTEQEFMALRGAVSDVAWNHITCPLDLKAVNEFTKRRFIRQGYVGGDLKTYDFAKLYVGANNFAAGGPTGKIYFNYELELHTPQVIDPVSTVSSAIMYGGSAAARSFTNGVPYNIPSDYSFGQSAMFMVTGPAFLCLTPGVYQIQAIASVTIYNTVASEVLIANLRITAPGFVGSTPISTFRADAPYNLTTTFAALTVTGYVVVTEANVAAADTVSVTVDTAGSTAASPQISAQSFQWSIRAI